MLNTAETTGNLQPINRGRGSVHGKLLRRIIEGRGILAKMTGFLLKTGQGEQISRAKEEESDQILRVIRYQGVGLSKLNWQDSC